jgi:hypothetical protein
MKQPQWSTEPMAWSPRLLLAAPGRLSRLPPLIS